MYNRCCLIVAFIVSLISARQGACYEVLGVGCPSIDIVFKADPETVARVGESRQIDAITLASLLSLVDRDRAVITSGGSCSNTIKGIASLGGNCTFFGMMGRDAFGELYLKKIRELGIFPICLESDHSTQIVISFVSSDGNRTMVCHPGAANEITSSDLYPSLFDAMKLAHFEGYLLYVKDPSFTEAAMIQAKANRALVSIDMSGYMLVNLRRQQLTHLLENYVDIVFANEDEARAFTGKDPWEACQILSGYCSVVVVIMGDRKSVV
jgi:sugar/nucleoside kinase (ribokinase family)